MILNQIPVTIYTVMSTNRRKVKNKSLSVRFPEEIYDALSDIAVRETRTMNQQILHYIKLGLSKQRSECYETPEEHESNFAIEKIGEGMIKNGYMTMQQVNKVLQLQKEKQSIARKFGEVAVQLEMLDQNTLDDYLVELEKKSSS